MILQQTSNLNYIPKRIISLVPSQTELLSDLGLEDETVGITKFCVHPPGWFKTKEKIGGTKTVNIDKVLKLQPDLIIANKEENVQEQVEALSAHCPVWLTDVKNLEDAYKMIADIGQLTSRVTQAQALVHSINIAFNELKNISDHPNTAYLIWKDPLMTVGGDTFISHLLEKAGFHNLYAYTKRYPEISMEDLQTKDCKILLLSSEPYPFSEKHVATFLTMLPDVKILLVNGEMFSWYGSRLLESPAYFHKLRVEAGLA